MKTVVEKKQLYAAVKAFLNDTRVYGVGDYVTFPTTNYRYPLGWGRIRQDPDVENGQFVVYNELHEDLNSYYHILGYDLANAKPFAYRHPDPEVELLLRPFPSSTVREILNIDIETDRSATTNFLDALGLPVRPGDLVSYIPERSRDISVGRIFGIDGTAHVVYVADILKPGVQSSALYTHFALLPVTDEMRTKICTMNTEDRKNISF
jgi:hypothetical protein